MGAKAYCSSSRRSPVAKALGYGGVAAGRDWLSSPLLPGPLAPWLRALGAIQGIAQLFHMLEADGEGDVHALGKEAALDLGFKREVAAVAGDESFGHGATVAVGATPGDVVVGACRQQTALFHILAAVVIAKEVATGDGFVL